MVIISGVPIFRIFTVLVTGLSKNIDKDQEPIQLHPTSGPQNLKRQKQRHKLINVHERQLTEGTTLPETGGHSATQIENNSNIYFKVFSILHYKTKQNWKQLLFR